MNVGYHDPCHLGRRMGVYDEPRSILASIPGLKLVEPAENREKARCCGGGGGVRSADKERAMKMARERMKGFDECGADVVASACPFCEINLTEATDREVVDVVELVARSLRGDAR
ncbi:MAG: heterodisulfide reductase-related iron-sulfur binding cluster [candidate division NC10 bacterium]